MKDAYFKSKEKRIIKFLQFENEESALRIKEYLNDGKSFDDLDEHLKNRISLDTIEYVGKLPSVEDSVFSITTDDKIKLINEGHRYFLVELQHIKRNIFTSENDYNANKRKLNKMLKQKKSIQSFNIYKKKYFKPYMYQLNQKVFLEMVKKMDEKLFVNPIKETFENKNIPDLLGDKTFDSLSKKNIIQFNDGDNWKVEELISRMSVSPYPIDFHNRGKFRTSITAATKHILDDEVILKHSLNKDLDKTEYVINESQMWNDYIISKKMMKLIISENSALYTNEKALNKIDTFLTDKLPDYNIELNYDKLDTLKLRKTDMVVFKTHFPERTINPLIEPLPDLRKFKAAVSKHSN